MGVDICPLMAPSDQLDNMDLQVSPTMSDCGTDHAIVPVIQLLPPKRC